MPEIRPGHVIQGPRWPEPVDVKLVEDMGDYIHLVGATTGSGEHVDQLIPRGELSQLQMDSWSAASACGRKWGKQRSKGGCSNEQE